MKLYNYIIDNRIMMDWRPYLDELVVRVEGGSSLLAIKDKDINPQKMDRYTEKWQKKIKK